MYSLVITGSRNCESYDIIQDELNRILLLYGKPALFIHGGCRGVDLLGERYATEKKIPIQAFHLDWKQYDQSAVFIRNRQIAESLNPKNDICVAFWDGQSKGTQNMIHNCLSLYIHTIINII